MSLAIGVFLAVVALSVHVQQWSADLEKPLFELPFWVIGLYVLWSLNVCAISRSLIAITSLLYFASLAVGYHVLEVVWSYEVVATAFDITILVLCVEWWRKHLFREEVVSIADAPPNNRLYTDT